MLSWKQFVNAFFFVVAMPQKEIIAIVEECVMMDLTIQLGLVSD